MAASFIHPKCVLHGAVVGLLFLGCAVWFCLLLPARSWSCSRLQEDPMANLLVCVPLPLHCSISLAVLGTPAGLSFGKYFFFSPLNMSALKVSFIHSFDLCLPLPC